MEQVEILVDMRSAEGQWLDAFQLMLETDKHGTTTVEDLEGFHPVGWDHRANLGVDDWAKVGTRNHTPGGSSSWFSSGSSSFKDDRLISPTYNLTSHASLEFWHWVDLQSGFDGAVLEISEDDGEMWTDLGPYIVVGGYDRELIGENPIAGRQGWSGLESGWRRVVVDLSAWGDGRPIRLGWRLTCDDAIAGDGWWVDDIAIHYDEAVCDAHPCGIPGEVELIAVSRNSSAALLEWAADPLCLDFRVWRSTDPLQPASFNDVTAEDGDPTDASFLDGSGEPQLFWIIQGHGPDGDGPWGHYDQ
jgi:hypothetical protein